MSDSTRKADTYRKIQLGGLVIKAGLGGYDSAVLLGLLLEGAAQLQSVSEVERLRGLGDVEFGGRRRTNDTGGVADSGGSWGAKSGTG